MTESITTESAAEAFTPATEPEIIPDDRSITAKWNIGQPDAEGYQPQVRLTVSHWKYGNGAGYYDAQLTVLQVKPEPWGESTKVNIGPTGRRVCLHKQNATRFNRSRLERVYEEALGELRRRFGDGDQAVTAFFSPASVEYAS